MLKSFMLFALTSAIASADAKVALKGFDPVSLVAGKEAPGDPGKTETVGIYTYQFANEESRAEFKRNPTKYTIKLAGSCARMGPFSGMGSPDRYAVHKGAIYIFASEPCRMTFLKDPDRFIPSQDEPVTGTKSQADEGMKLLNKAAERIDPEGKLIKLSSVKLVAKITYKTADGPYVIERETLASFPNRIRVFEKGPTYQSIMTAAGLGGSRKEKEGDLPLDPADSHYLLRSLANHPALWLPLRQQSGFLAYHQGEQIIDGKTCQVVNTWHQGVAARLCIDTDSGDVRQITRRAITSAGMGESSLRFSAYQDAKGLRLPYNYYPVRASGDLVLEPVNEMPTLILNPPVDGTLFAQPNTKPNLNHK